MNTKTMQLRSFPVALHKALKVKAAQAGMTLTAYCVKVLSAK